MTPRVSVIIPFFNDGHLLPGSAGSVLSQTWRDLELILVDDGSTHACEAADDLVRRDARVRVIRKPNGGTASARNAGIETARGEFIAFLDVDDLFLPGKIERQLRWIERTNSKVSHTSYRVTFPARHLGPAVIRSGRFRGWKFPDIRGGCPISMSTAMVHRSLFEQTRFIEARRDTDIVFWCTLAIENEFCGLDEPLSEVRYRETSAVVNYRAAIEGLTVQRDLLRADPRFEACRSWVDGMTQRIERITRRSRLHPGEVDEHAVRAIFFPPPLWKQLRRRVGSAVRRLRSRDTAIWSL